MRVQFPPSQPYFTVDELVKSMRFERIERNLIGGSTPSREAKWRNPPYFVLMRCLYAIIYLAISRHIQQIFYKFTDYDLIKCLVHLTLIAKALLKKIHTANLMVKINFEIILMRFKSESILSKWRPTQQTKHIR